MDTSRTENSKLTALRTFVYRTAMLRDVAYLTHFGTLVHVAITDLPGANEKRMDAAIRVARIMTEEHARIIGGDLASSRRDFADPKQVVMLLLSRYNLMKKLAAKHVWFAPMLEAIASRLQGCAVSNTEFVIGRARDRALRSARKSLIQIQQLRGMTAFDQTCWIPPPIMMPQTPRTPRKAPLALDDSDSDGDHSTPTASKGNQRSPEAPENASLDAQHDGVSIIEEDADSFHSVVSCAHPRPGRFRFLEVSGCGLLALS